MASRETTRPTREPDGADTVSGPAPVPGESSLRVGAVILAAGRSTRMGRPKTSLLFAGRTLLDHAIDNAVASRAIEVVVVVRRDEADRLRASERHRAVCIVRTEAADEGLSDSLRRGLAALSPEAEAAAILLADQPGVDTELIDRVIGAADDVDAAATRPVFVDGDRRVPGHPVVMRRRLFTAADALRGDEGARAILEREGVAMHGLEIHAPAPPDVDTPDDYARLLATESDRRA